MRVITYNVRGGLGLDGRRDTGRVAGVVSAECPDIVCFQEVHRWLPWSGWVNQPRHIEKAVGMPFVFQANVRFGLGGYGLGIATRYPVRHVRRHRLPSVREMRGVLEVGVETGGGLVTIFCTHWGLSRDERRRQAEATQGLLLAVTTPVVFCADLNDRSDADYVTAMRTEANLCDCGAATDLPTYPADSPADRIDVVYASPVLREGGLFVVDAAASDHRPVVADFGWGADMEGTSCDGGL